MEVDLDPSGSWTAGKWSGDQTFQEVDTSSQQPDSVDKKPEEPSTEPLHQKELSSSSSSLPDSSVLVTTHSPEIIILDDD